MKKAFTFQQLALILLALVILVGLLLIVILQKDQITEAITNIFGAGASATDNLENQIDGLLSNQEIWRVRKL